MDNGSKWMYLDGHVGYGDWHHQIAEQLAPRAGINDHDTKAISNYALVNAIPAMEGHDIAWGHLHHNMPVIWNTNVDRNAVNDAVSRGISAADMASQSDGGRGIASDSLNSDDYNQNGGNVSVAGWHESMFGGSPSGLDIEERRRGSVFGNQAPWYIADGRVIVGNYGQTAEEIGWEEGMTRGTVDILGALTCHAGRAPRLKVEAAVRRRYAGMEASFPVEAAERARKARSWWVEA